MANPVPQDDLPANIVPADDLPSAVAPKKKSLLERYGKSALRFGPAGIGMQGMSDANEAIGTAAKAAGGRVAEFAGRQGVPAEIAGGLGVGANMAVNALPMAIGGGLGAKAAPVIESGASRLMQSALKPAKADMKSGDAQRAMATLFDEWKNPTVGGIGKMEASASDLHDKVASLIARSPANIKADVSAYLDKVVKRYEARPDRLQAELEIANVEKAFANHPLVGGNLFIPVQDAHKLKKGFQDANKYNYGAEATPTSEAEKAIAWGMREKVAATDKQIAPLNARESDLINAINVTKNGNALISGNKNIVGMGSLSPTPTSLAVWLLDRFAGGKAGLAQLLHHGAKPIGEGAGAVTGLTAAQLADLQRR